MQKHHYYKIGLIACIAVLTASFQVRADMAEASGLLAEIFVAATQASGAQAEAANADPFVQEDLDAANEQAALIDEAITAALAAYETLEASGGTDAAAMDALRNARQQAVGEDAQEVTSDEDFVLPNIYDVPWQSDGLRTLYDTLFQIEQSTSAQGGSSFAERDVTDI